MAGGIAAVIGIVVAIWPDLWLGLFTADPGALASGRTYLSIVGPVYGFFGVAMALYFASQGTGEMYWPVVANLTPHHHRRRRQPAGARRVRLGRVAASSPSWRSASWPSPPCSPSRRRGGRGEGRDVGDRDPPQRGGLLRATRS